MEDQLPLEGEVVKTPAVKPKAKKISPKPGTKTKRQAKPKKITKAIVKTKPPKKDKPKLSVVALGLWQNYMEKDIVDDFSKVPTYVKLTWLQNIPPDFIKERPLTGSVKIAYVPHEFAEKALNFAFNFNVSCEIISKDGREGKTKGGKQFYECELEVKFTFKDGDRTIIKTVFAGHKSYVNDATTRADCYKSAASKAYTVVARQFGIASNVKGFKATNKGVTMAKLESEAYQAAKLETEAPQSPQGDKTKTKSWMDK